MQINFKVVHKKPNELTANQFNTDIFSDGLQQNPAYIELKASIALCGIRQPLIIKQSGNVRSGNMRLRCAIDLGLKSVPCIVEDEIEGLKSIQEGNDELLEKYKTIIHDLKKKDTVYSKIVWLETLNEVYKIRQGVRTDKDEKLADYIKERNKIGSQTERTKLKNIRKNLETAFPGNIPLQDQWLKSQGTKSNTKTISREARKLAVKKNENPELANVPFDYITDPIKIYNQSCFDLSKIADGSIQNIITSPPYFLMRPPQGDISTTEEIGTETDIDLYTDRLVDCFVRCKSKLTVDGTIWVNLADVMKHGRFQLAPELFMIKMLKAGFICNDKLFWVKSNTQPGDGDNSFQNVEYLLKFSLCEKPYTDYGWLSKTQNFEGSTFGKSSRIRLSSFINLKNGFVTTSAAHTGQLRNACEKEQFYLAHSSTFPPEIPYLCIKLSSKTNSHVMDIFNGCGNTAKAVLYAKELGLTYHGFEINPLSVRASAINLKMDTELPSTTIKDISSYPQEAA